MNLPIMIKLLHTLEELRTHEHWARQQLEAHQAKALQDLRQYAYERSPFYQKFHKGLAERPLQELPVLTKAMMMEHYDELATDRSLHLEEIRAFAEQGEAGQPYKNHYWVNATSGSSGHPGFFLFDEPEWLQVLASFARSQEWSGVRINLTRRHALTTGEIDPYTGPISPVVSAWRLWLRSVPGICPRRSPRP